MRGVLGIVVGGGFELEGGVLDGDVEVVGHARLQVSQHLGGVAVGAVLTGVTPGLAGPNSTDGGGNTGWSFASPPDATTTTATSLTTTTATLRGTVEEFEKNQGRYEQLVELSDMLTIKPTKKESP